MFETIDETEIPIPPIFSDDGARHWPFVTLSLHIPWIYVMYAIQNSNGMKFTKMAFLSRISDLLDIANTKQLKVRDVNIVLPGHMTGKKSWTMEPLAEIWEGVEGAESDPPGQAAHVYVTASGTRYLFSRLCDLESELKDMKRIFENPCLRLDS